MYMCYVLVYVHGWRVESSIPHTKKNKRRFSARKGKGAMGWSRFAKFFLDSLGEVNALQR